MIKNDKNFLTVAYNTATELKKEKTINDYNLYSKKYKKFKVPKAVFQDEFKYSINFECVDESILNIDIEASFSENVNVNIYVNNILVYDKNISYININKVVSVKNINNIDIICKSTNSVEIDDFVVEICGNFKYVTKCDVFNLKTRAQEIALLKTMSDNKYFSVFDTLEDFKNSFYKSIEKLNFDGILDYTFSLNLSGEKTEIVYVYKNENNVLVLTDGTNVLPIATGEILDATVFPANKEGATFAVIYLLNGDVNLTLVNSNFQVIKNVILELGINEKIIAVGCADNVNDLTFNAVYFVTNNSNVYVAIAKDNSEVVEYNKPYKVGRGDNCLMTQKDKFLYVFAYHNNSLLLNKFQINVANEITSASKVYSGKFNNCDYGFLYENVVYVVSDGNITMVGEI